MIEASDDLREEFILEAQQAFGLTFEHLPNVQCLMTESDQDHEAYKALQQ